MAACEEHLRRTWLLGELSGSLDRVRARLDEFLVLDDSDLIAALAGQRTEQISVAHHAFNGADAARQRSDASACGVELICACEPDYPAGLRSLQSPPAVLHVFGKAARLQALADVDAVALVGTRRASEYGLVLAESLARELASVGLPVISGMAGGIDAAAHRGALAGSGMTVAVLPAAPQRPYPASARRLHRGIVETGAVVSELGPGVEVRPWMLVARNRMIAALASLTVVVEAPERSGALITAGVARELGRVVGAVPGAVVSRTATGTNQLLRDGAVLIRNVDDVLIELCLPQHRASRHDARQRPTPAQAKLLEALRDGADSVTALTCAELPLEQLLAELTALELSGWVRRGSGGRLTVVP